MPPNPASMLLTKLTESGVLRWQPYDCQNIIYETERFRFDISVSRSVAHGFEISI